MSFLTDNILLEQLGITDNCEISRDYCYYTNDEKLLFTIKRGFISDLDSIPSVLQSVVRGTKPRYWRAYILHDGLYRTGCVSRLEADLILDQALELLGMDWYTRSKIYYGLRMFGNSTTNEDLIENAINYFKMENYDSNINKPSPVLHQFSVKAVLSAFFV